MVPQRQDRERAVSGNDSPVPHKSDRCIVVPAPQILQESRARCRPPLRRVAHPWQMGEPLTRDCDKTYGTLGDQPGSNR
jgi:hypothetical protein